MNKLTGTGQLSAKVGHNKGTATFEFVEDRDGGLTGTYTGLVGNAELAGNVAGDQVEFSFDSTGGGRVTYLGTREGDKMSGNCTYEAAGSGVFEGHRA